MKDILQTNELLGAELARLLPRILTQASRDPHSATAGSFDRDWWHYRIRDFSSAILQQAAWTAFLAADLPAFAADRAALTRLAADGARFWNTRAIRYGAFEEYYPWERGYPVAAFSTRAMLKLVEAGVVPADDVRAGVKVAAKQLLARFEPEAANQQVAGLAALALIRKFYPEYVPAAKLAEQAARTLALQHDEGWYMEYGGPDLAYLSVTLDALWDLADVTGESRYRESAARALRFLHAQVGVLGASTGMGNARNTDYVLPYGIARFLRNGSAEEQGQAAFLFTTLYGNLESPDHFLHAIDDRYLCHYTGHSLVRAWNLVRQLDAATLPAPVAPPPGEKLFAGAGQVLRLGGEAEISALFALKKGGVFSARLGEKRCADFGWIVRQGGTQFVTHWWGGDWAWRQAADGSGIVTGHLVPHSETISSPVKHLALRAASFLLGEKMAPWLKSVLIFKKRQSPLAFERQIAISGRSIVVCDEITGLQPGVDILPAPRASKRHVSSADSFHREDFALTRGVKVERAARREGAAFRAETTFSFEG
ncbi:MAG: hypothetical protein NTY53_11400 [Kiritimatiellaeota bacterium]|nr:hypothetical protein [Kiritimatiellota bacterium]